FERVAEERPLVIAVDDVHWAEPTLLDLLDYLVAFSTGQPILVVAIGRPELLETRPEWAAPLDNRELLLVRPLAEAEARGAGPGARAGGGGGGGGGGAGRCSGRGAGRRSRRCRRHGAPPRRRHVAGRGRRGP